MKNILLYAAPLLAVCALHAGDNSGFGFQATVARPAGDMTSKDWMDGKYGYGVGVHSLVDLGGGIALVPRIDYTRYKENQTVTGSLGLIQEDAKIEILSGGVDINFYLGGEARKGFYVLGGLGYARGKFERTYTPDAIPGSVAETKSSLYLQAGIGLNFTPNIGIECRYQALKFKDVETSVLDVPVSKADINCPSLQATLILRF